MLLGPDLAETIASGFSDGLTYFGDLGIDLGFYRQRIENIVTKHLGPGSEPAGIVAFVGRLHRRDLYLAAACAKAGVDATEGVVTVHSSMAWNAFADRYKGFIESLLRCSASRNFLRQDLADDLLADLFLPDQSGRSRIASYDGRSSLASWLRVVIANRAINAQRSPAGQSQPMEQEIPDVPAFRTLEQVISAGKYGAILSDSLTEACRRLTPTESLILLWRFEDNLQLGRIGQLLGIHQSSVTRRLERIYGKLRKHVYTVLSVRHGMSDAAIHDCLEDIADNPHHRFSILDFIRSSNKKQDEPPLRRAGSGMDLRRLESARSSQCNRPNTPTLLVVPTYTLPWAIVGVMNLLPAPK